MYEYGCIDGSGIHTFDSMRSLFDYCDNQPNQGQQLIYKVSERDSNTTIICYYPTKQAVRWDDDGEFKSYISGSRVEAGIILARLYDAITSRSV